MKQLSVLIALFASGAAFATEAAKIPANLEAPTGNTEFLRVTAEGTQQYVCLPGKAESTFAWTLFGPQATLFGGTNGRDVVGSHFLGADGSGATHPTWQAADLSRAQGTVAVTVNDAGVIGEGNVPWLLLKASATSAGKAGGSTLVKTTFVQRIKTSGGVAPAGGCSATGDVGVKSLVPYTATYVFYSGQ